MSGRRVGVVTRGTTAPNRLRRVDRWLLHRYCSYLRQQPTALCVDLGFGAQATTTVEWFERLRQHVRPDINVLGIEIDASRVAAAQLLIQPGLSFAIGGFEVPTAGREVHIIRAFNVLRQYPEVEVASSWALMGSRLASGGVLIDGTCDEIGRLSSWIALGDGPSGFGPQSFTLSVQLTSLHSPSQVAARLPKVLIHRNVQGEAIHDFLVAMDAAWAAHVGLGVFSARQRFVSAVENLRSQGWPIHDSATRWRLGEVTVDWSAVAPR